MNTKTNIHFRQLIRTAVLLLFLAGFQQFAWAYDATVTTVNELKTALANASGTAPYEIFIKNGTYDLGTVYNTEVKSYTHLIGESCDGVIIKNSPTTEGLGTTATLKTGSNVSIKNLTLKCRAAWAGSAERGVCLWDAGTGNTYENICLDGLQDTYYSKGSAGMTCTFKDCIIRGTVDFICGSGNITFNNCSLELYIPHSGSTPIIAAPATYTSEKDGYIFNNCTIKAATTSIDCPKSSSTTHSTASVTAGKYYLGRAWYAGSSTDRTPKLTFNDVTYDSDLIPNSALWTKMSDSDVMPATFSVSEKAIEMSYPATAIWNFTNSNYATQSGDFRIRALTGVPLAMEICGGIRDNGNSIQISSENTSFKVPVGSTNDVITITTYSKNNNLTFKIGDTEYTDVVTVYSPTSAEVANGYVKIVSTNTQYLVSIQVDRKHPDVETATVIPERTIVWDWKNKKPEDIITKTKFSSSGTKTGFVASTISGVLLYVDATNSGKLEGRESDAQFNQNTIIQVPVRSAGDVVTAVSYPNYHSYTVGGTAANADTYEYTATAVDATNGYVEIKATGGAYLYSISVKQIEYTLEPPASRTFKDFKVKFQDVSSITEGTTYYVTSVTDDGTPTYTAETSDNYLATFKGKYHDQTYGLTGNLEIVIPNVDGPVKLSFGMTDYNHEIIVTDAEGNTIDKKDLNSTSKWSASKPDENLQTIIYNSLTPTTLTVKIVKDAVYIPYLKVEACDYIPQVTVTYYNTDGTTVIGSEVINGGSALAYKYDAANVTVLDGYKFRGWFDKASGGKKVAAGTSVNADLNLYAVATEIEVCDFGKTFNYNLTDPLFYPEDHECIDIEDGKYNGSQHGWQVNKSLSVPVAGKAILSFTLCTYSNTQTISITDGSGSVLKTISHENQKGDQDITFKYDGLATTLKIVMQTSAYIHNIKIENLPLEDPKLQHVYGKETVTLNVGGTYTLTKDVDFTDNYTDNNYTYTSSNTEIVAVDANGNITAGNKYGQAVVTVHHDNAVPLAAADLQFTVKVISKDGQVSKPALTINADGSISVTGSSAEETGISFYYTDNGDEPTASSNKVADGTIASTETNGKVIKIIAIDDEDSKSPSDIVTAYVNVGGTFTWEWNKSGTLQMVPTITGNVRDIVDENTKAVIGKKLTSGFVDGNGIKGVSVTPNGSSSVVYTPDEESSISFNIIPVAGIAFKPTDVKFKAANNVTSSGLMDVYLNSESKENRLLSAKYANSSSSMTDYPNGADKFETEISSIAAADEEWSLKTYIYTLTNTKSWIFSDVIISGTFTGVEYDGGFFGISASAEPADGGVVTHVPSALKAQAGKKVTFRASPNEGYKFVKWRDVDNEIEYTTPVTSIESLSSNVSYEAVFEKLPMVTFSMGKVADLTGNVPEAVYVDNEGKLTIPENTTLYKENYALTAWTDGTTEYAVGQEYTFSSDVTLTPVMTACAYNLPDTDKPVTAKWYFDQEDGAPIISWSEKTTVFTYTKGVMVNGAKIDVPMVMTGAKADNDDARVNFLKAADGSKAKGGQLNDNLTLMIPAVYGMKITVQASLKVDNIDKATPNETRFDVGNGEKAAYLWFLENSSDMKTTAAGDSTKTERNFQFTYKGDKKEIWIKVAKAGTTSTYGFYDYIEVEYPVLPQVKAANKIISDPILDRDEKPENAGKTEITAPDPNKNTGKRYKPGETVTLTAKAGYGYYISAFKDGDNVLAMKKLAPSAESDKPTQASVEYTVGETTGTVTVEYTRLPMAKVRLETVDGKLGSVDFGLEDIHENFYSKGDGYVESYFVAGKTAIASSDAADDYVLEKWVDATTDTKESDGASFTFNVPSEGGSVTYQAYFTLGKIGNVKFDVANAKERVKNAETGEYSLVTFKVDEKSTAPADQASCRSFYIPKYHGLFKTYDSAGNADGWSLKYWVDIKDNSKIYDIGKNYSFANENQEITLIPVFEQNPAGMQNRLNSPVLTYEFGTGPGIRAQRLDLGKEKDTYLCAPVYTEILQNSTDLSHTRDVALWINTGEKGYVRNSGFEEWAAIGPGTKLTVASCAGTKIEILSYAPITSTTIDGVVPTECQQIGEHEYVYSYTTQSPAARIPIVIGDDYGYYKWIKAHTLPANRVQLHTSSVNKEQGEITNTEAVTGDNEREYITKLEDGGYSLIQGTRVKVSFERKFGYVFDKIVDPDKIVDGEPFTVLQMLDKDKVSMVKPDDAKESEEVAANEDGTSWGDKDKVFILRKIEPTDEEKRKGQRTRYEVEFEITKHRNLQFYFKEKPTYYITFNPGKEATGIAPTAKWVEEGDEYVIPKNSTLYYSGFTLKRWKSEDGTKTYNIGATYKAPADNLRLFPEFEANTFSLFDNDLTKQSTATWNLTRNDGAPDLAYERSSGILVTQLKKNPDDAESDFIDLCIDLNASDREIGENESKTTVHGKFNNMNYDDRCQINMYSILSFPVTKGCEVSMEATSIISTTNIAGATADNGGYTAGKQVTMTWNGAEGTQEVNFQSDGRYYTYFAVTYKPQTIEKPALKSVSISGTELTEEQLTELKEKGSITLDAYPVKLDPKTGKFVEEKMDEVQATASGTGKTEIEQPSLDNPTAVIRLLTSGNMRLNTYTINFTLKATESSVEGAETTPQFVRTVINGEEFKSHEVSVENMPASGYIQVEFDRTMKAMELSFKIGGKEMKFSAAQGKKLTFYYWNIPNATLEYTISKDKFVDIYGVPHAEADFVKIFKTRSTTKELYQKTFDFIVGKDGTLDEAIAAANKDEGTTDRYLIFVPDGEYQLTGNEPLESYGITSDGKWPCDENGDERTDMLDKNNGRTVVSRPKVSIIGQSREGVKIFNHPIVEGISYTSTIHVGKNAADFYAEDLSLENQFNYWNSMKGGSGAGRAVVLWDQGQRTTLKNVSMMSWQDTYYSSNAAADYRSYFENCAIGGVVDWICGDGNIWFQQCDIVVRDRSGNNLAAPSQDAIQQWGYVFKDCNIVPEFPLSQMEKLKDKTWTLARPWANSPTKSPACTFINTKMSVLPKDQGWGSMGSGAVLRFHENHTIDGDGTVLSLGARSLAACVPAAGSDDCVMNDTEAKKYTIENVLGGSDSFTPKERTMQIDAVSGGSDAYDKYNSVAWEDNIETDDDRLTWQPHPNALCYFVFKLENGKWNYKTNITETSISLDQLTLGTGTYCVRAANQYGGLGAPTKAIDYQEVRRYQLTLSQLGDLKVDGVPYGWSTICLPYNARVPEGVKVYAVTAHNKTEEASDVMDYYVTLTETDYLNKDKGYIVYGPAGDYVFKATSREGTKATILRGNPTDYPVSSVNNNCYILANRTYGLGFYKFTGTELKPYRAWLPADKVVSDVNVGLSSGAKGLRFVFSDDADLPTGILDCLYGNPTDTDAEGLYNLSGQRVKTPASRGIYIRRGQGKSVMGE